MSKRTTPLECWSGWKKSQSQSRTRSHDDASLGVQQVRVIRFGSSGRLLVVRTFWRSVCERVLGHRWIIQVDDLAVGWIFLELQDGEDMDVGMCACMSMRL